MISYKPLRDFMYFNNIKITDIIKLGINSRTAAKFSKDEHVSLETITKICLHYNIPIEAVVEVIPKSND